MVTLIFAVTDVFLIKVAKFLPNLAMIGQIIKIWQPFFKIQDGGAVIIIIIIIIIIKTTISIAP